MLLHLLPGAIVTAGFAVAVPLGIRFGVPPLLTFLCLGTFHVIPIELGYLLFQARKKNSTFSLRGIVLYRERIPAWQYPALALPLLGWMFFLSLILSSPMDRYLINHFFAWLPDWFFVQRSFAELDRYSRISLQVTGILWILINGLIGPIVEELYFRGYLMPRMVRLRKWAPLMNSVLFLIYHFFSPWQNPLRILGFTPLFYVVWWKRNIYLGMIVHCLINISGGVGFLVLVF